MRESIKAAEDVAKIVEPAAKKAESALKEIGEVAQQLVKKIEATEAAADSFVQKGTIEEKIVSPLENIANDVVKKINDSEDLAISVPKWRKRYKPHLLNQELRLSSRRNNKI